MEKQKQNQQPDYDFRDAHNKSNGIAVVGKGGKFGYINREGVEITPLKYDHAVRFRGCTVRVQLNGKWGCVNSQGKEIIPPVYDEIKGCINPIVRLGDKYGYVSEKTGKLLTPVKYDGARDWTYIQDGHWAAVQIDGKWGCINARGREIVPPIYDDITINEGCFAVNLDGKWGFLNKNGTIKTAFEYDDVEEYSIGRARVKKNGKYGFIDTKFTVVIPLVYDDCEPHFSYAGYSNKRILPLWVKRDGKYGCIDISGNVKIKPKYEFAQSFHRMGVGDYETNPYFAAVVMDGKAGFINEAEKIVIPCKYEPDFNDRGNYCFIYDGFVNVRFDGKWGVINTKNQVIIPFLYDEFLHDIHNGGFRCAMRDGRKLSIDAKGNEWDYKKNAVARTFRDYLHAVSWVDVAESFMSLLGENGSSYEENFNNFRSKQHQPSNDIIRIFANRWKDPDERSPVSATMFSVENACSYTFFDWEEILDMEVRIEDNLTLTDADVVAVCIWEAGDCHPMTEESIKSFLKSLDDGTYHDWIAFDEE
jgi:hypothetical protein